MFIAALDVLTLRALLLTFSAPQYPFDELKVIEFAVIFLLLILEFEVSQ